MNSQEYGGQESIPDGVLGVIPSATAQIAVGQRGIDQAEHSRKSLVRRVAERERLTLAGEPVVLLKRSRQRIFQAGNLYYIARSLQIRGGIGRMHVNASLGTRENIVV